MHQLVTHGCTRRHGKIWIVTCKLYPNGIAEKRRCWYSPSSSVMSMRDSEQFSQRKKHLQKQQQTCAKMLLEDIEMKRRYQWEQDEDIKWIKQWQQMLRKIIKKNIERKIERRSQFITDPCKSTKDLLVERDQTRQVHSDKYKGLAPGECYRANQLTFDTTRCKGANLERGSGSRNGSAPLIGTNGIPCKVYKNVISC